MKTEFQMSQSEMDEIILINKNMPPVMKIGNYISGMDLQERINDFWKYLGDLYGFDHMTVEASGKSNLHFLAEQKKVDPMASYEAERKSHEAYCEQKKPKRENYLTEKAFTTDWAEWDRMRFMDAPNKPGYYRANND